MKNRQVVQGSGEVLWCTTLLRNVIVLVLGILVFEFKGIPNLFVLVIRLVKAISSKKSWRHETYVCLTFIFLITRSIYCNSVRAKRTKLVNP